MDKVVFLREHTCMLSYYNNVVLNSLDIDSHKPIIREIIIYFDQYGRLYQVPLYLNCDY
jgi:hypothetical protein